MASKLDSKIKITRIGKISGRSETQDTHVLGSEVLITPREVKSRLPGTKKAYETVIKGRRDVETILNHNDQRLFIVMGPCSIHDPQAAYQYAINLKKLAGIVKSTMVLIMRVYFEKPRTTIGWKGLINDPDMNDSFRIEKGILLARRLLLKFNELGLPTATEALDPIIPQYIADLVSWSAIGARTTESQTHREIASGLSMPVGFKNATDGSIQVALNGLKSARTAHHFLGINQNGKTAVIRTSGNTYAHIVLRGGVKPNYDGESISACEKALKMAGLPQNIVVDCSHGNSNKDYRLQPVAFNNVLGQIIKGNKSVVGFMLESNLNEGNQPLLKDRSKLKYGVSITDGCINWVTTEELILSAHQKLKKLWAK